MTDTAANPNDGFSQGNKRALRNPWVVGWILLVIVVFSVNALMIGLAFWSNPGLVVKDYYERGKDYEETISTRIAARNALGWKIGLEMANKPVVKQPAEFRFVANDKVGVPLQGARVHITAYRPSDASADFESVISEVAPGQYSGKITFPLKGIWDLQISFIRGDHRYDVTRRISVLAQ